MKHILNSFVPGTRGTQRVAWLPLLLCLMLLVTVFLPAAALAEGTEADAAGDTEDRILSDEELAWVNAHGTIRVGYRDRYMPFSGTDSNTGEPTGMISSYCREAAGVMGNGELTFRLMPFADTETAVGAMRRGEVDCVFPVSMDEAAAQDAGVLISDMVLKSQMMVLVAEKKAKTFKFDDHVRAAVNEGNISYLEYLKLNYPDWEVVTFPDSESCLKGISRGEADCYVISSHRLTSLSRQINRYDLIGITTNTATECHFAVSAADPVLFSIINKIIRDISTSVVEGMVVSNSIPDTSVTFQDILKDYPFAVVAVIAAILLIITVFWMRTYKAKMEQKQAQEARSIAEAANEAKTAFLFNMSHDIRTPMNAIMGFRDLLEKYQEDPEKRADYLHKISESSNVLLSIINNVLEMSRIEKGVLELDEVVWSAEQFNDTLYSIFNAMMTEKGVKFTNRVNVEHSFVFCDTAKLREIFYNILSNAYKYTPPGGSVDMELTELPCEREGYGLFRTTVSDTGIGISEDFLPLIFEEFSREQDSTGNKIEGTGLGMPIVKRLVDFLGGTIEIRSEKGKGTTVTVSIPLQIAESSEIPVDPVLVVDPEIFRGKRILLAEDNDLNAEIAIELLEEVGFLVERAEDGKVCYEMLLGAKREYYDLILMDIQMPNMNGYDATRLIRQLSDPVKASIPILALTANAFDADRREAFRSGMNGHLSKPVNVHELMRALAGVLRKEQR